MTGVDTGGNIPHCHGMNSLIDDIDTFCRSRGMSESAFGILAANDKNLVPQIRAGRDLRMSTVNRIRDFMLRGEAA